MQPQLRRTNRGWRIDYFLIPTTTNIEQNICDCNIMPDIMGSDHCPISLTMNTSATAVKKKYKLKLVESFDNK